MDVGGFLLSLLQSEKLQTGGCHLAEEQDPEQKDKLGQVRSSALRETTKESLQLSGARSWWLPSGPYCSGVCKADYTQLRSVNIHCRGVRKHLKPSCGDVFEWAGLLGPGCQVLLTRSGCSHARQDTLCSMSAGVSWRAPGCAGCEFPQTRTHPAYIAMGPWWHVHVPFCSLTRLELLLVINQSLTCPCIAILFVVWHLSALKTW